MFEHFLDHFWGHFGGHFGTRSAQEGAKMGPRGPSRAPKTQKVAFAKTLKNLQFFQVFGVQRPPKRALGGPRGLPRGTQRAPKPNKKGIQKCTPKISNFWTNFGTIFGAILGSEFAQKLDQKWDHFWNPLPPHLRGPGVAILQNKRECCKSYCDWNYIRQKKGRDVFVRILSLSCFQSPAWLVLADFGLQSGDQTTVK